MWPWITVFLVSRMHEDWLQSGDNHDAVTRGQAETGHVITAAASITALVFASFVFGGERIIKEFGVGLRDGHPDRRSGGSDRPGAVGDASVRTVELGGSRAGWTASFRASHSMVRKSAARGPARSRPPKGPASGSR